MSLQLNGCGLGQGLWITYAVLW